MMTAHEGSGAGEESRRKSVPQPGAGPQTVKAPGRVSYVAFLNTWDAIRPLYCSPVFHCVQVAR